MPKITVKNITKVFGPKPQVGVDMLNEGKSKDEILNETGMTVGVNQASFSVHSGEVFVIMGLSGSGKSTLIRLINRLIEPTDGEVWIDGENLVKMDDKTLLKTRSAKLGMVFQNFGLLPHRTVLSNVAYGLEIQKVNKDEREKRALQAIEDMGLKGYESSYPKELSGGMQQRVGIARALANDTDILLIDEAFSALDPIIRKEMQDEIITLQKKLGKTILFITLDLDEALKLGDRIAIMKDGSIVQIGSAEEILENPANDYVSNFVKDVDRSKVLVAKQVMERPDVIVINKDGVLSAVKKMKDDKISSIFVVDKSNKLKRLLTIDGAIQARTENRPIEEMLITDIPSTTPDQPLKDLMETAIHAKYPITVLDDGEFLGIVSRVSILSSLVLEKDKNEVKKS